VCKLKHASSKEIKISGSRNLLDTDFLENNSWTVFFVYFYRPEEGVISAAVLHGYSFND
jgi:hypothetical protein